MNIKVRQALSEMGKRFPNQEFTFDDARAYEEDLSDLADMDEDSVVAAIVELRRSMTRLPTVADIRTRTVEVMDRDIWVMEAAAWGEIERLAKRYGRDKRTVVLKQVNGRELGVVEEMPPFSSPVIGAAVEAIGWDNICLAEQKEKTALRAQFREAIKAIQARMKDALVSGYAQPRPARLATGSGAAPPRAIGEIIDGLRDAQEGR